MILKFLLDFRYQLFLLAIFLYLGNLPYFIIRLIFGKKARDNFLHRKMKSVLGPDQGELAASWVNFF